MNETISVRMNLWANIRANVLLTLLYLSCCIMISFLAVKGLNYLISINIGQEVQQGDEFAIVAQELAIPTERELQDLKETYQKISAYSADISALEEEMIRLHSDVKNAVVCSEANRSFNTLAEYYATYQQKIEEIKKLISSYTKRYDAYSDAISKIPKFSSTYEKKNKEFTSEFKAGYATIEGYSKEVENLEALYLEAKQIADDLFEEYYDLMCRIVTLESGTCGTLERCYVANVLENRIKSSIYPNTLYDVVHDPVQYEPVMKGMINRPASESVKKDMEEYLRGRIETGMPDYVLYQALFPQGKGTWKHMPSGHYFCF